MNWWPALLVLCWIGATFGCVHWAVTGPAHRVAFAAYLLVGFGGALLLILTA